MSECVERGGVLTSTANSQRSSMVFYVVLGKGVWLDVDV